MADMKSCSNFSQLRKSNNPYSHETFGLTCPRKHCCSGQLHASSHQSMLCSHAVP